MCVLITSLILNSARQSHPDAPTSQAALEALAARGMRATLFGILASATLAAVKILGGILGYSYALIADGIESMVDILSSLIVLGSLKVSAHPPNERFPYGYGKIEPLGTLMVAGALLTAALGLSIQSVREIVTPHHAPAAFTLIILVGVVTAKELMFRTLSKTAGAIGSHVLRADAWHHRSDAFTSLAAFVGISIALIAGEGYEAADDWAALAACVVIAVNGIRLFRTALTEVMDGAPAGKILHSIRGIAENVEGVRQIEKCLVRRSGLGLFVDIHVVVDGSLPVHEGHRIAHQVKDALLASTAGVFDALVHIEPFQDDT